MILGPTLDVEIPVVRPRTQSPLVGAHQFALGQDVALHGVEQRLFIDTRLHIEGRLPWSVPAGASKTAGSGTFSGRPVMSPGIL